MDGDELGGHLNIDANMVDNNNIVGDNYGFDNNNIVGDDYGFDNNKIVSDNYGFDNIDLSDNGSDGNNSDSGNGGGSREYNGGGYEFDGGSGGGGDDFGVFDFCEEDDQPYVTMLVPLVDDELRDAPPIQTFSVVEGLRQVPHRDTMVVANPTIDEVEPFQLVSDSLDFGDVGEGDNVHQECDPCNVEPPEHMNAPSRITSPNVPLDMLTTPLFINLAQSPRLCTLLPAYCPLTHSIANQRGIATTLIMAHGVPCNANHTPICPRSSSETMRDNRGTATQSFPSLSTVDECGFVSIIGIST